MKSLFKTVFIIILFSVITRVIAFLFKIYVSRTIGTQALGEYQVSFSIFMVLLTIISSGLPFVISRLTALYVAKKDKQSEHKIVTAGMIISFVCSIILCLLVLLFIPLLRNIFTDERCVTILILLLPALVFSSFYSSIRANFWGKSNYLALCSTELIEEIARVIIFIILISFIPFSTNGANLLAVSLSIACVFSAIVVMTYYLIKGGKLKFVKDKNIYKQLIKKSTPITSVRIAGSLIQPLIALIVPLRLVSAGYTSAQAMSLFGIAMGMTLPFLFIPSTITGSLSTALVPDLSGAIAKNDTNHIKTRILSAIKVTIFVSVLFIPLYFGAGIYIGEFFYNNAQSGAMLASSSWVLLPLGLTNISSSLLNSLGYEIKSMRNYILGAIILVLSIWFLPKLIGINALIWAFGGCFIITCILNLKMISKIIKCKLNLTKQIIIQLLIVIPSASICSLTVNLLVHFMPLFFALATSCTLGAICFTLLCLVFNVVEIKPLLMKIKDKFKKKKKKSKNIYKIQIIK